MSQILDPRLEHDVKSAVTEQKEGRLRRSLTSPNGNVPHGIGLPLGGRWPPVADDAWVARVQRPYGQRRWQIWICGSARQACEQ